MSQSLDYWEVKFSQCAEKLNADPEDIVYLEGMVLVMAYDIDQAIHAATSLGSLCGDMVITSCERIE